MADIRLIRPRGSGLWLWIGALVAVSLLVWAIGFFVADPTEAARERRVGASANFGGERAPVLPVEAASFASVVPLGDGDLGRLLQLRGVVESRVVNNAMWIRTEGGRRIMVRFEPAPPPEALAAFGPGRSVDLQGYLTRIARAEFDVWADTLRIALPQPPQRVGIKFGEVPDSAFQRVDALFIRNYYISVRPEAIAPAPQRS
jgi:hypothetical protein